MKVLSSRLFESVRLRSTLSSKKESRVCVAEGTLRETKEPLEVVIKMYLKERVVNYEHLLNEKKVLEHIRDGTGMSKEEKTHFPHLHDTLVLEDRETGETYICLALKYLRGFTLDKYLSKNRSVSLCFFKRKLIQIIESLGALHRENIIHRDIKCSNIMLEEETDNVVLIDMGLSRMLENKSQRLDEFCGSFHSMAPEMLCTEKPDYGLSYDWWSVGVLTYEVLFGTPPFGYHPEENKYLLRRIKESPRRVRFGILSADCLRQGKKRDSGLSVTMYKC
ncbi:hypothetical protein FG386_000680 [Cryptosporidium ryanae]|uniref:uncharacterized protein n=1 Tax=Cryptosporidium ryanae TaxID=515981 RepID=UPI00351A712B|nr:hypothetical protein FG386_000680 [Cryptosporidium ryanae]